jgi:hypothetical protein
MAEDDRTRREIEWAVGSKCKPPYGEPESPGVQWMRVESDLIPDPYEDVRLRYELRSGTWVCSGLYVLAEDLSSQELTERFPFAQFKQQAMDGLSMMTKTRPPRVTAPRRRGRLGNSDEFLTQIAALYRYATSHPKYHHAPIAFMREQEDLWRNDEPPHEDTVRAWVRQARKRGLLGASIHGKAGEQASEDPE